jgi:hypothetical protein
MSLLYIPYQKLLSYIVVIAGFAHSHITLMILSTDQGSGDFRTVSKIYKMKEQTLYTELFRSF